MESYKYNIYQTQSNISLVLTMTHATLWTLLLGICHFVLSASDIETLGDGNIPECPKDLHLRGTSLQVAQLCPWACKQ